MTELNVVEVEVVSGGVIPNIDAAMDAGVGAYISGCGFWASVAIGWSYL